GETYRCAFVFPDHSETRFLERLPGRGTLVFDRHGSSWIVTEALQSGQRTYTVFAGPMTEYRESLRREDGGIDVAAELLNVARQSLNAAGRGRRRFKDRNSLP
ncbi:MAG TPA: hypothetical protein VEW90_07830, partial [Gaiellaceae bacterium]|nr:hypothetical protein [Gaiellaceae bacterium]